MDQRGFEGSGVGGCFAFLRKCHKHTWLNNAFKRKMMMHRLYISASALTRSLLLSYSRESVWLRDASGVYVVWIFNLPFNYPLKSEMCKASTTTFQAWQFCNCFCDSFVKD